MAPKKKARLAEKEDIFAASGAEVQHQIAEWETWQQKVGVRKPSKVRIVKHPKKRLGKFHQRAWHYYTDPVRLQSWIMTPFLISAEAGVIQPLVGADERADLFQCTVGGHTMQHYSNIHRVSHLASTHPRVSSVTPHKINKRLEQSEFNKQGRCTKYHQSPWDLEITLKESGAQMHVGCTVSKVAANLLSFWWTLVHRHGWTEQVKSIGEAIFSTLQRSSTKVWRSKAMSCGL